MPLYEYLCNSCGNRYEKIQKADEQPDTVCPKCGGEVERPLTTPAFQFKGSGWYITDYAKSGGSKSSGSDKAASSESSSKSESSASSESKPASESSPKASETKPSSGSAS